MSLQLKGFIKMGHFHVNCERCDRHVHFSNLRWVGGVLQVEAKCRKCEETEGFQLLIQTWGEIFPIPED